MIIYGEAISALRVRFLAIGATGVLAGIAAFAVGCSMTPRIDVVGYVDIARLAYVDALGNSRVELVAPPVVLAGQVNSGAFFGNGEDPSAGSLRRARVIARVPPRADNIELSVRVDAVAEGRQAVQDVVRSMNAAHRAQQQPAIERLRKQVTMIQAEVDELVNARRQLDRLFAGGAGGTARDSMQHYFLVSLRAQSNREIRELQRLRETTADGIRQMEERETRLMGNLMPQRASLLVPLAMGIIGGIAGGLLAAAVVLVLAYRRGARVRD